MSLKEELAQRIEGDVEDSPEIIKEHATDASIFKVTPEVVVFPKHKEDVEKLVSFVKEEKEKGRDISLTGRSAGTDMSGGPLSDSIIVSFTRYMNDFSVHPQELTARVEPGVYYRDLEEEIEEYDVMLPSFPASKKLAALGGMIMNNAAGELTLRYGKTARYVDELDMTLADGNTYMFRKLSRTELDNKLREDTFEGEVYRKVHTLLKENYDRIQRARPDVSKNSAGYALWDVYDKKAQTFDLTKLFVGSQGTLGLFSRAKVRLVKTKKHRRLMTLFLKDWNRIPEIVNAFLPLDPEGLESFDDATLKLGLRFMPQIAKRSGEKLIPFLLKFLPEAWIGVKMLGLPKMIILVEFAEDTAEEADDKMRRASELAEKIGVAHRAFPREKEAEKYWIVRRESFALLRGSVEGKRTAPFIDDFCVKPEHLPEFLPKVLKILKEHKIKATIAGHAGSGNFHIIPLMDLSNEHEKEKIPVVSDKVYDLIVEYKGSITAEHNDGLIRSPYLRKMFGDEMMKIFERVKEIFDPQNIFNPGKKVYSDLDYAMNHIDHG